MTAVFAISEQLTSKTLYRRLQCTDLFRRYRRQIIALLFCWFLSDNSRNFKSREIESSLDQNDEGANNEAAAVPHDQLVSFKRDNDIVSAEL